MSAALCPRCRQPTSPVTGFCDACGWPRARKSAPENAAAVPAGAPPAASSGAAPPPFWQPAPPAWQPPPPAWQPAPPAPYGYPPPAPPYGYPPPPAPYGYPPPGVPGPLFVPPGYAAPRMVPVAQELARKSSGARWGAAFVDFLLIFVIWFAALTLYRGAFADGPPGGAGFLAITLLIGFSYYIVPDAAGVGTVGKMLTGVRVYDINLKPASAAQIAVRSLELLAWAILFGLLFALLQSYYIGKNGQGVGDSIAKTYVIKKKELAPFVAPPA